MDSSASVLGEFEQAFLRRLFDSISAIHLSGGSALGIHLRHRRSLDLDLFTTDDATFRAARASLPVIAASLGARIEILTDGPGFRRVLLSGPAGQTLRVDLVLDTTERIGGPPVEFEGLRVEPLREILLNKICAILGGSEPRDLVDLPGPRGPPGARRARRRQAKGCRADLSAARVGDQPGPARPPPRWPARGRVTRRATDLPHATRRGAGTAQLSGLIRRKGRRP